VGETPKKKLEEAIERYIKMIEAEKKESTRLKKK